MTETKRVAEFNREEAETFNTLRRGLKQGHIPVSLVNPKIIELHNEISPSVAQISPLESISLDALLVLIVGNSEVGREARMFSRKILQKATKKESEEDSKPDFSNMSRRDRMLHSQMENES